MKQFQFLLVALLLLLTSCGSVKNLSNAELSLIGTTWTYEDDTHEWVYDNTFLENGVLETKHPNDRTPDSDTWKQDKTILEFSYNNGYSSYKGERISLNKITGTANNSAGKEWKWTLTKK